MRINLTVIEGPHEGREFTFQEHDNFIVGRAKVAHFQLLVHDKYFSRIHFMVEINPPLCRLLDMGSTNGTSVNGRKANATELHDGDLIKAGKTVIRVTVQDVEDLRGEARDPIHDNHSISESQPPSFRFEHAALALPPDSVPVRDTAPKPIAVDGSPSAVEASATVRRAVVNGLCSVCGARLPDSPGSDTWSGFQPYSLALCPACLSQIRMHPQPIEGYQIVRELGRGSMGLVYLAIRVPDRVVVALKTIQPAVAGTKVQIERFLREARILGQLDHPRIVTLREAGESNGLLYFAMDYVPGSDAAELQKQHGGPLQIERAVEMVCQILSALEYAHEKGFVHRDIKPANLLVEEKDGRELVRLADFGLARTYQTSPLSGLTLQGSIGGTVAFMAPEQIIQFREAKPPVDQYAAGATLYKLLTDKPVFDLPRKIEQKLLMILQDDPVPIRSRRPEISEALAAVVHRSIAKAPKARFPNVGSMKAALASSARNR